MKKLKKNGGFTLVEMLIVVAIIAILIAVSIPMVNNALEKSRHAVDQANIRDALALGNIELLTGDKPESGTTNTYSYIVDDSHQGTLGAESATDAVKPECTCPEKTDKALTVTVDWSKGTVTANWKTSDKGVTVEKTTTTTTE